MNPFLAGLLAMTGLIKHPTYDLPKLKKDRWGRGSKGKHSGERKVPVMMRLWLREGKREGTPATPTRSTFVDQNRHKSYRVFSDGSYRLMKQTGRRIIGV